MLHPRGAHDSVCRVALGPATECVSTEAIISQALEAPPMQALHVVGRGPRAALRAWNSDHRTVSETNAWLEDARLQSILGGCGRSLASVKSVFLMLCGGAV